MTAQNSRVSFIRKTNVSSKKVSQHCESSFDSHFPFQQMSQKFPGKIRQIIEKNFEKDFQHSLFDTLKIVLTTLPEKYRKSFRKCFIQSWKN